MPDLPGLRPRAADEAYTVKIPAGVKDGTRIKLKGKGEAGYGGAPAGDLYVVTRVEPSKIYERRGDDLVVAGAGDVHDGGARRRRRGADARRPRLAEGPAGSEDGKLLRIKGRGAPKLKGGGRATCSRACGSRCRSASRRSSASCSRNAEGRQLNGRARRPARPGPARGARAADAEERTSRNGRRALGGGSSAAEPRPPSSARSPVSARCSSGSSPGTASSTRPHLRLARRRGRRRAGHLPRLAPPEDCLMDRARAT